MLRELVTQDETPTTGWRNSPERRRALLGMWVLVTSLAIFFTASMLLYVAYIALRSGRTPEADELFVVPRVFWVSTVLLMAVSGLLHWALLAARRDEFFDVTIRTGGALLAAVLFLSIQAQAMYELLIETRSLENTGISPYPYTMILALLHALHVVAGVVSLSVIVVQSFLRRFDHESQLGLELCGLYWHFLDLVWLVMLAAFYAAGSVYNRDAVALLP